MSTARSHSASSMTCRNLTRNVRASGSAGFGACAIGTSLELRGGAYSSEKTPGGGERALELRRRRRRRRDLEVELDELEAPPEDEEALFLARLPRGVADRGAVCNVGVDVGPVACPTALMVILWSACVSTSKSSTACALACAMTFDSNVSSSCVWMFCSVIFVGWEPVASNVPSIPSRQLWSSWILIVRFCSCGCCAGVAMASLRR